MAHNPSSVAFGFKKSTKTTNVGINVLDEGPTKIALSAVERGGVFRTVDGRDAAAVIQPPKKTLVIPMQANTYKVCKCLMRHVSLHATLCKDEVVCLPGTCVAGYSGDSHVSCKTFSSVHDFQAGGGKFAPSFVPPSSDAPEGGQTGDDKFEMAAPASAPTEPQTYGLQRVKRKAESAEEEGQRAGLGGSITERLTAAKQEEQAYQNQVEELPEMATVEVSA